MTNGHFIAKYGVLFYGGFVPASRDTKTHNETFGPQEDFSP